MFQKTTRQYKRQDPLKTLNGRSKDSEEVKNKA